MTMYTEAMNKFTKSDTAFMEQGILERAREDIEEAIAASTALARVGCGRQTLRSP